MQPSVSLVGPPSEQVLERDGVLETRPVRSPATAPSTASPTGCRSRCRAHPRNLALHAWGIASPDQTSPFSRPATLRRAREVMAGVVRLLLADSATTLLPLCPEPGRTGRKSGQSGSSIFRGTRSCWCCGVSPRSELLISGAPEKLVRSVGYGPLLPRCYRPAGPFEWPVCMVLGRRQTGPVTGRGVGRGRRRADDRSA
jgi:hypothetical protein